jgi:hypothetical protein
MPTAIAVFTAKSKASILAAGGSGRWVLDPVHARRCEYVLLCRNTKADWAPPRNEAPEPHGSVFMVLRLADVVLDQDPGKPHPARYRLLASEFAEVNIPDFWEWRTPVKYLELEELGIDPRTLDFRPMPPPESDGHPDAESPEREMLDGELAKQRLAAAYGVPPENVEITIRW